jgi:hypothetical protein
MAGILLRLAVSSTPIGGCLKTYVLYIHDDRYSVPTMDTLTVSSDARARELAVQRLGSSEHYRGVEIWEGDRLVEELSASPPAP